MTREKVEPAPRHRWTPKERAEIFTAAKGVCHLCDTKIRGDEPWDAEHPIPHFLGLPERVEDMKPAHKRCNQRKNNEEDTPLYAKTRRQAKKFGPDSERTVSANPICSPGFKPAQRRPAKSRRTDR